MKSSVMENMKEMNLKELENVGGGLIRRGLEYLGMGEFKEIFQVLDDKTGEVMTKFYDLHNAKAYARLMQVSGEMSGDYAFPDYGRFD